MKILVTDNFRHVSGAVAAGVAVDVFYRGTNDRAALFTDASGLGVLPNPATTDRQGNLSFYVDAGAYDFGALGARVPFDVKEPTGGSGDVRFVYTQPSPASVWIIPHQLGTKPSVVLQIDSEPGEQVWTDLSYPDLNTVLVEWPGPESGSAYLS